MKSFSSIASVAIVALANTNNNKMLAEASQDPVRDDMRRLGAPTTVVNLEDLKDRCGSADYHMDLAMDGAHMMVVAEPTDEEGSDCLPISIDLKDPKTKRLDEISEDNILDLNLFDLGKVVPLDRILGSFKNAKTSTDEYDAITNNCGKILGYMFLDLGIPVDDDMIDFATDNLLKVSDGDFGDSITSSPNYSAFYKAVGGLVSQSSFRDTVRSFIEYSVQSFMEEVELK